MNPPLMRAASPSLPAAGGELREVPKSRPQHRPLQRTEGQEVLTLNEAKFLKERSELNADREEEKAIDLLLDGGVKRDYYLDEAMAITADYLNLEQLAKSQPPASGKRA